MSESYRVVKEVRFAAGEVVRVGDLFRDNDNGLIQDTYRVEAIRKYRRSGLHVVFRVIRRERDGQVITPDTVFMWPIEAMADDRIVRVEAGDQ